jgi:hypothetical protein
VAVKVALLAPAGTVTELGTFRFGLLLLQETVSPPLGAGPLNLTVHSPDPGVITDAALQLSPVSTGCEGSSVRLKFSELLPKIAVSWTVAEAVTGAAETVNAALLAPACTITDPGTVRFGLLLFTKTAMPPFGAGPFKLTVQVLAAGAAKDPGVQLSPLKAGNCGV